MIMASGMSLMLDGRLVGARARGAGSAPGRVRRVPRSWGDVPASGSRFGRRASMRRAGFCQAGWRDRLAQQQALQARRVRRERIVAGIGVLAAGSVALALLIVPVVLGAGLTLSFWSGAPTLLANVVEMVARWLVTFRALGEAGRSIVGVLCSFWRADPGGLCADADRRPRGLGLMMRKSASRRWGGTLTVLVWF